MKISWINLWNKNKTRRGDLMSEEEWEEWEEEDEDIWEEIEEEEETE